MRPPLALLRRLHRSIAYTALDVLIGQRVTVRSAETAPDDVIDCLRGHYALEVTTREPDLRYRIGAILKYGLLDLTFGVASTDLQAARSGIGILRDVGWADSPADADVFDEEGLFDLVRDAESGQFVLKVFLDSDGRLPFPREQRTIRLPEAVPPSFWPATFVVRDACLTNVRAIWLFKHFYL